MTLFSAYALRMSRQAGFDRLGASWATPVGVAESAYTSGEGDRDSQPQDTPSAGVGRRGRD
ncbi:MAG TPA: hypothetical protein VHB25_18420 [Gemmatimonadaceae bacterium]|nr:hypothetical protein [Gemmatimonadaceae bacterium]